VILLSSDTIPDFMTKINRAVDTAHGRTGRTIVPLIKNSMEKILLAMDGYKQNTYAIDFACYLAKLTHSGLTGVFLEGTPEWGLPAIVRMQEPEVVEELSDVHLAADPVLQHVRQFREACLCREVPARVHRDRGVPVGDILVESRFSDLIVVDPETSFRNADKLFPGRFIRDVLLAAECPVVVSPYRFEALNEVIFAYNGTSSSVFAIKQFTYLFPEFKHKKAVVVNVRNNEEAAIEEQYKMKEWLSAHYEEVEFVLLKGDASDELFGYLLEQKNAIVVMGAYGRGILSRFLKPSHASLLLRTINLPIFIAHR
jgi:nucleotide-binding universal stress UspA family protein